MSEPSAPDPVRYAVRRDWPDGRHDYFRLSLLPGDAQKGVDTDREYWRKGPMRPTEYRVVAMTAAVFEAHRSTDPCKSTNCP